MYRVIPLRVRHVNYLFQSQHCRRDFPSPAMVALGTDLTGISIPTVVHFIYNCQSWLMLFFFSLASNALQYGSKGCYSNACSNQNCMFSLKNVHGGSPIRTINENLFIDWSLFLNIIHEDRYLTSSLLQKPPSSTATSPLSMVTAVSCLLFASPSSEITSIEPCVLYCVLNVQHRCNI